MLLEKSNNKTPNSSSEENILNTKKIFPTVSVNLEYVKSKYNSMINSDIVIREFIINVRGKQYSAFLLYIDGMINTDIMNRFVIEPLMLRNKSNLFDGSHDRIISEAVANNITVRKVKKFNLPEYIMNCLMPQNNVKTQSKFSEIISSINSRKLCFIY